MQQEQREMCEYCGKWFPVKDMVTMYEKGKFDSYYCMSCYPEVKDNIKSLPWRDNYTFYRK